MAEPAVISGLWIGNRLSTMEQLCLLSFVRNGHPYHLYLYEEVDNVPTGVILKDADEILPRSRIFKYKNYDSYAGFANLFRYRLLSENGGYWVDTDVVCLRPLDFASDFVFATQRPRDGTFQCASCVIKSPLGSRIMEYCYGISAKQDPNTLQWAETGPFLLTRAVREFDMMEYVVPHTTFCPIDWWKWRDVINTSPEVRKRLDADMNGSRVYAVHLWNEMWRREKEDKGLTYPADCLYERLKQRYLI